MRSFLGNIVMNKADEVIPGGEPIVEVPKTPPAEAPKVEADGNLDNYGYEKDPKEETPPKKEEPKKPEDEIPVAAGGYGKDPLKVEEEAPPATPPATPPELNEIEKELAELPEADRPAFKKLVEDLEAAKTPKEKAKILSDARKGELAESAKFSETQKKEYDRAVLKQRADWDKELRSDKDFGGDNFDKSLSQVQRLMDDFMPGIKKALTDKGGMLPPYVMRDYVALAKAVYATDKLIQGDPSVPTKAKEEVNSALDFYT